MMNSTPQPANADDWNLYYATIPADDIPWEVGGPSYELTNALADGSIMPPARVLDIGCGLGTQSIFLAKNGFEVIGVDIAPKAIEKATKLANFSQAQVKFKVADATSVPFPSESFDLVYDRACFHHLKPDQQERYKGEITRILTDGGVFMLTLFAKAANTKVLEQFFSPAFALVNEDIYTMPEKGTSNVITLRSLLFEKHPAMFFEAN